MAALRLLDSRHNQEAEKQNQKQREREEWERGREQRKRDGYGFVRMAIYLRQQSKVLERTRRDREIAAVYWSEVRPKYFRNVTALYPKILNSTESKLSDKRIAKRRDFYVIAKLHPMPAGVSDTSNS